MATNPYSLWSTRKSLGVIRDRKREDFMFSGFTTNTHFSDSEWIDFSKLPIRSRDVAPFVKPKGRGRGITTDRMTGFRFKPANVVLEDAVDMERGLSFEPGIDGSAFDGLQLTPMQRRELIKADMLMQFDAAYDRRLEWMRAKALIDGAMTIVYEDGETFVLDFQRAAGHTEVLGAGDRYGDTDVSILDHWQTVFDTVNDAEFGGVVTKIVMGGSVAPVVRKDAEILAHLDTNISGGTVRVDRGLVGGAAYGGKVYKFGELMVGGASGQRIELWVNNETYTAPNGTTTRYVGAKEVVFLSDPSAIQLHECFGRVEDVDAEFKAMRRFVKNYTEQNGRVTTEGLSLEGAPLVVPINPNATYKATVLA